MLTDSELREMGARASAAATAPDRMRDVLFAIPEPGRSFGLKVVNQYAEDVPRLLAEIDRLVDELDHWRKRALFAEQFNHKQSREAEERVEGRPK